MDDFNLTIPTTGVESNDSKGNSTQNAIGSAIAAAAAVPSPHSVTQYHSGSTDMSLANGK